MYKLKFERLQLANKTLTPIWYHEYYYNTFGLILFLISICCRKIVLSLVSIITIHFVQYYS